MHEHFIQNMYGSVVQSTRHHLELPACCTGACRGAAAGFSSKNPPAGPSLNALSSGRGGVKAPLKPCNEMVPCEGAMHDLTKSSHWPVLAYSISTVQPIHISHAISGIVLAQMLPRRLLSKPASLEKLTAISLKARFPYGTDARTIHRDDNYSKKECF